MKIELTQEQLSYAEEFKNFAKKWVIPYAEDFDSIGQISNEVIEQLSKKGYLGSMLPKKYGGMAFDNIALGILNEEIGKGCSSVRSLLTVHGMVALAILKLGTEEQKNNWLPKMAKGEVIGAFGLTEPEVGSDAKNIQSVGILEGDYYQLNGKKKWITMGQIADIFLFFVQCEGKPTAFIVEKDTPGLSIKPIKDLLGAKASHIAEISLENCMVPKSNMVGNVGSGLSLVALSCLDYGRYTIAWGCVGMGQACLELSVKYAKKRKQFGKPLRKQQLIQQMITDMVVSIKAARLLCFNTGYLRDIRDPESIMETWNAKYYASKMINKVASNAIQIHGANGCSKAYQVERFYRDAKIMEIIEGTTQMHEILIATSAFRQY